MAIDQSRGTKLKKRKKHKSDKGSPSRLTHFSEGDAKSVSVNTKGGNSKTVLTKVDFANVASDGTVKKVKIKSVEESAANRDFKRMHIITKGAIIDTELGKAKVTSRPSQQGVVNAVLVK